MSNTVDTWPKPWIADGAALVERLLMAMESLPAQPPVALRVLWLCDDPESNARSLAEAVELDPVLTVRILRMANSAFYGMRSPVGNVPRAITVVGFSTVRAVAATSLTGIGSAAPDGFWQHAASVANASQLIAHQFGVPANDAFAAGLLHDLGIGLLHVAVPGGWDIVAAAGGGRRAELSFFGIGHDEAGGRVLSAWRLPTSLCEAVSRHSRPFSGTESALTRTLIAAEVVADLAGLKTCGCEPSATEADLHASGLEGERLSRLVDRVQRESEALSSVLVG